MAWRTHENVLVEMLEKVLAYKYLSVIRARKKLSETEQMERTTGLIKINYSSRRLKSVEQCLVQSNSQTKCGSTNLNQSLNARKGAVDAIIEPSAPPTSSRLKAR